MSLDLTAALDERVREVARQVAAEVVEETSTPRARYVTKDVWQRATGVSDRYLKTLRAQGLPARKVGKSLFFNLDETDKWIEERGRRA